MRASEREREKERKREREGKRQSEKVFERERGRTERGSTRVGVERTWEADG